MKFEWNSAKAKEVARKAGMKALRTGAEAILSQAIDETPLDTGTLRRSGTVSVGGLVDGTGGTVESGSEQKVYISFNTPYAARQHEEIGLRHPMGGKAKYLEDPLNRNAAKVQKLAELTIRKALEDAT